MSDNSGTQTLDLELSMRRLRTPLQLSSPDQGGYPQDRKERDMADARTPQSSALNIEHRDRQQGGAIGV